MTTVESPVIPQPYYASDATRAIERIVEAADRQVVAAEKILARRTKARADVTDAEKAFLISLSDQDAQKLANAKRHVQELEFAAAAIEDAGGLAGVHYRSVHQPETFETLVAGFAERVEVLGALLPKANTALARARFSATEAGLPGITLEFQPEIQSLRLLVESIIAHRNDASVLLQWCRVWTPQLKMNRTFIDLRGALESPLPV